MYSRSTAALDPEQQATLISAWQAWILNCMWRQYLTPSSCPVCIYMHGICALCAYITQGCVVLEKHFCSHHGTRLPLSRPIRVKVVTAVWLQLAQCDANAPFHLLSLRAKIEHDWIRLLARPSECGFREWERFCGFCLFVCFVLF